MADVVAPTNFDQSLASLSPNDGLLPLMCSSVRALISSRSNSASPPSTVSINRPCGVVVSAQASERPEARAPLADSIEHEQITC